MTLLVTTSTIKETGTNANRSVYAIAAPCRDNWVTKEECVVAGATARPGSRRGLPPGVTVFANAIINKTTS